MTAEEYLDAVEQVKTLAVLRAQLHLKRKVLADAIGVTSRTVKRWESGENEPTPLAARRLVPTIEALQEIVSRRAAAELEEISKRRPAWRRKK
jgi:DNA-binding transcriptional regulator YiaG